MKSPAITATVEGKNKTLYLQVINLWFPTVFVFAVQSHSNASLRCVPIKLGDWAIVQVVV